MKFIFSGISRKAKNKIKICLILAALVAGSLIAVESRYAVFRLRDIEVSPQGILPQHAIWGTLSSAQERCWPFFWVLRGSYEGLIEKYYPVDIKLFLSGWGRVTMKVFPLKPAFMMYWGGRFWYVSTGGKVWQASLVENKFVPEEAVRSLPILSWGSDRITPIDLTADHGNVLSSSLPIPRILKWYENLNSIGWSHSVKFIQAGVKEGQPVVRLIFYNQVGESGVDMLFTDDPAEWHASALAVKKIYQDPKKIPPGISIDTTYKDKILVKNKVE
ncbi:MAG: hypothetical protein LLF78_08455 [Synergistaceae bacterium]|nr:hypothetical protein [Synergistaceae bacterium]